MTPLVVETGPRTPAELLALLQPGDVLLYTASSAFGKLITIKTWSDFSHSELFLGPVDALTPVWASRDPKRWLPKPSGGGVNFYPFRHSALAVIRRPVMPVDMEAVRAFCVSTVGQKYDWWGLMRFFTVGRGKQDRMFCSEAVTRALRVGGCALYDNADADEIAPGWLDTTRDLRDVWRLRLHT